MKKYKGWEIAKLISEGKLEGKKIGVVGATSIFFRVARSVILEKNVQKEVGGSILSSADNEFIIVQEPVTFMDCVNSNKNIRVNHPLVNELFKHIHIPMNLSNVLFQITNNLDGSEELRRVILEGKWYLEEADNE